jgi:hypothetical protein
MLFDRRPRGPLWLGDSPGRDRWIQRQSHGPRPCGENRTITDSPAGRLLPGLRENSVFIVVTGSLDSLVFAEMPKFPAAVLADES